MRIQNRIEQFVAHVPRYDTEIPCPLRLRALLLRGGCCCCGSALLPGALCATYPYVTTAAAARRTAAWSAPLRHHSPSRCCCAGSLPRFIACLSMVLLFIFFFFFFAFIHVLKDACVFFWRPVVCLLKCLQVCIISRHLLHARRGLPILLLIPCLYTAAENQAGYSLLFSTAHTGTSAASSRAGGSSRHGSARAPSYSGTFHSARIAMALLLPMMPCSPSCRAPGHLGAALSGRLIPACAHCPGTRSCLQCRSLHSCSGLTYA
jgi:hypothetical protein